MPGRKVSLPNTKLSLPSTSKMSLDARFTRMAYSPYQVGTEVWWLILRISN